MGPAKEQTPEELANVLAGPAKDIDFLTATIDALSLLGYRAHVPLADRWVGATLEVDDAIREKERRWDALAHMLGAGLMRAVDPSVPTEESAAHVEYLIELARRGVMQYRRDLERVYSAEARALERAPSEVKDAKAFASRVLEHNDRYVTDPEYSARVRARALDTE